MWHGGVAVGGRDAILLYYVTREYDPRNPDEERKAWEALPFSWVTDLRFAMAIDQCLVTVTGPCFVMVTDQCLAMAIGRYSATDPCSAMATGLNMAIMITTMAIASESDAVCDLKLESS